MNPKHGTLGTKNNNTGGDGSDVDLLGRTAALAFESAKAVLDRYDELVSTAHRQTAVLLWRGITPPTHDDYLGSSLDMTTRAVVAALSQGIALTEIAAKLQLEGLALFRRMAAESMAAMHAPQARAGTKRSSL